MEERCISLSLVISALSLLSWEFVADMHTPQELAAMNDCTDILRYLDGIASKQVIHVRVNIMVKAVNAVINMDIILVI